MFAVVIGLVVVTVGGMLEIGVLIAMKIDPVAIALIASPTTTALGGLVGILASTRTAPPVPVQQAYQQGALDLASLAAGAPADPAAPPPPPGPGAAITG